MTNTTNPADAVGLLPCPFCGGQAVRREYDPSKPSEPFGLVADHAEDCFLQFPHDTESFYAAWNHRLASSTPEPVATTQAPDAVERAKEALTWIRDRAIKLRKGTDDWFELVEFEAFAGQGLAALSTLPTADAGPVAQGGSE